jgi:hypothetical protein
MPPAQVRAKITDSVEVLLEFYNYSGEHCRLRIESTFANRSAAPSAGTRRRERLLSGTARSVQWIARSGSSRLSGLNVQRMLGHFSAALTLDIFAGLFADDLDAVAERLDEIARPHVADYLRTREAAS